MKINDAQIAQIKAETTAYLARYALYRLARERAEDVLPYIQFWQQQGFLPQHQVQADNAKTYLQDLSGEKPGASSKLEFMAQHLPMLDKMQALLAHEKQQTDLQKLAAQLPGFEDGQHAQQAQHTADVAEHYFKEPDFNVSVSAIKQQGKRRVVDLTIPDGFSVDLIQVWFAKNDIRLNGVRISTKTDNEGYLAFVYNGNHGVCPEHLEADYIETIVEWLYRGAAQLREPAPTPQTPPAEGLGIRIKQTAPTPEQTSGFDHQLGYDDFFSDAVSEPTDAPDVQAEEARVSVDDDWHIGIVDEEGDEEVKPDASAKAAIKIPAKEDVPEDIDAVLDSALDDLVKAEEDENLAALVAKLDAIGKETDATPSLAEDEPTNDDLKALLADIGVKLESEPAPESELSKAPESKKPEEQTIQPELAGALKEFHEKYTTILQTARAMKTSGYDLSEFFSRAALAKENDGGLKVPKVKNVETKNIVKDIVVLMAACIEARKAMAHVLRDKAASTAQKQQAQAAIKAINALVDEPLVQLKRSMENWLEQGSPEELPSKAENVEPGTAAQEVTPDPEDELYIKSSHVLHDLPVYKENFHQGVLAGEINKITEPAANASGLQVMVARGQRTYVKHRTDPELAYNKFRANVIDSVEKYRAQSLPAKELQLQGILKGMGELNQNFLDAIGRVLGYEELFHLQGEQVITASADALGFLSSYATDDNFEANNFMLAQTKAASFKQANEILRADKTLLVLAFVSNYLQNNGMPKSKSEISNFEQHISNKFAQAAQRPELTQSAAAKQAGKLLGGLGSLCLAYRQAGKNHQNAIKKVPGEINAGRAMDKNQLNVRHTQRNLHESEIELASAYLSLVHLKSTRGVSKQVSENVERSLATCREFLKQNVQKGKISPYAEMHTNSLLALVQNETIQKTYSAVAELGSLSDKMHHKAMTVLLQAPKYLKEDKVNEVCGRIQEAARESINEVDKVLDSVNAMVEKEAEQRISGPEKVNVDSKHGPDLKV
jgi:hypothetical protein